MITFYELQVTQMNEESPWESSLNLTLTQHPNDEDPKLQKVHLRLEVEPPRTWYFSKLSYYFLAHMCMYST
jgi:hypothetical protein